MLWVLNFSDGKHSLLDIAEKSNLQFGIIHSAAQTLLKHGLLQVSARGNCSKLWVLCGERLTTKDTKTTKKDSLMAKSWEDGKFQIWARWPSDCPHQNQERQEVLIYK